MTTNSRENKTNCWEFLKCGREPGGEKANELGVCHATIHNPSDNFLDGKNGGRACAYITGTFCGNEVQGSYIDKQEKCAECEFYKRLKDKHGEDLKVDNYNKYIKEYFDNLGDKDTLLSSAKINSLILKLADNYFPFNKISRRRFSQIIDLFRIVELETSEVTQLRKNKKPIYLYILKGNVDVVQNDSIRSFSMFDTQGKPLLITENMGRVSLVAGEPSTVFLVDKHLTDEIVGWDCAFSAARNADLYGMESGAVIVKSPLLRQLPKHTLGIVMERLTERKVKKGEVIIEAGELNEQYYIISSGKAEIFLKNSADSKEAKIAELGSGDSFGAQSVVSGAPSNRKISMLEEGVLLTLNKKDFIELIKNPLVEAVKAEKAQNMIKQGHKIIDARFAEEYEAEHIPGALNIPLSELSERLSELDVNAKHIVYSNTENRGVTAAILLKRNNYQAVVLEKGLRSWPFEKNGSLESFRQRASVYGLKKPRGASLRRDRVIKD